MLRKVHQIYGATGATFAKAMNEGQSTIGNTLWTNEHVRNAAQSAATQAAQHTVQVFQILLFVGLIWPGQGGFEVVENFDHKFMILKF